MTKDGLMFYSFGIFFIIGSICGYVALFSKTPKIEEEKICMNNRFVSEELNEAYKNTIKCYTKQELFEKAKNNDVLEEKIKMLEEYLNITQKTTMNDCGLYDIKYIKK